MFNIEYIQCLTMNVFNVKVKQKLLNVINVKRIIISYNVPWSFLLEFIISKTISFWNKYY